MAFFELRLTDSLDLGASERDLSFEWGTWSVELRVRPVEGSSATAHVAASGLDLLRLEAAARPDGVHLWADKGPDFDCMPVPAGLAFLEAQARQARELAAVLRTLLEQRDDDEEA